MILPNWNRALTPPSPGQAIILSTLTFIFEPNSSYELAFCLTACYTEAGSCAEAASFKEHASSSEKTLFSEAISHSYAP